MALKDQQGLATTGKLAHETGIPATTWEQWMRDGVIPFVQPAGPRGRRYIHRQVAEDILEVALGRRAKLGDWKTRAGGLQLSEDDADTAARKVQRRAEVKADPDAKPVKSSKHPVTGKRLPKGTVAFVRPDGTYQLWKYGDDPDWPDVIEEGEVR